MTTVYMNTFFPLQVNGLSLCNSKLLASCADDGSLRLWSVHDREQALQFQVREQVNFINHQSLVSVDSTC